MFTFIQPLLTKSLFFSLFLSCLHRHKPDRRYLVICIHSHVRTHVCTHSTSLFPPFFLFHPSLLTSTSKSKSICLYIVRWLRGFITAFQQKCQQVKNHISRKHTNIEIILYDLEPFVQHQLKTMQFDNFRIFSVSFYTVPFSQLCS